MNVFIVLIPMLLMSAVFMEIRVIEMSLPQAEAAEPPPPTEPFDVAIRIVANAYVVEGNGVALQSIPREASRGTAAPGEATSAQLSQVLAEIVAAHPETKEVRIIAAATTRYREIVAVMDLARAAGLPLAALEGAEAGGI